MKPAARERPHDALVERGQGREVELLEGARERKASDVEAHADPLRLREPENAVGRPVREEAEEVAHVGGSMPWSWQLAMSEMNVAFTSPSSSEPTKSQFFRLSASRRGAARAPRSCCVSAAARP
jgi:hypothetical protein